MAGTGFEHPDVGFLLPALLALLLRTSPADLLANLRQPIVLKAIGLSLATSLTATLITVLLGTPLAYGLARNYFRHGRLLDTLVDMRSCCLRRLLAWRC